MRLDLYTKAVLTAITLLLAVLALQSTLHTVPVLADSDQPHFYIEPGITNLRKTDGSSLGDGKVVIDLRNGDVWGFPTVQFGALYPVDISTNKPPTATPTYLGRFDFSAMKQMP
jgi:hypothetical protein